RRTGPSGVLLRYAGPRPVRKRARGARTASAAERRRLGRQAEAGRSERAARRPASLSELRGRGRRHAGRVRLLRLDETGARREGRTARRPGRAPAAQALLEG